MGEVEEYPKESKKYKYRKEVCYKCDKLNKGEFVDQCSVCGCYLDIKWGVPFFHCPEKKW